MKNELIIGSMGILLIVFLTSVATIRYGAQMRAFKTSSSVSGTSSDTNQSARATVELTASVVAEHSAD